MRDLRHRGRKGRARGAGGGGVEVGPARAALLVALLPAALGASCSPRSPADAPAGSRALYELERLALVPPGPCKIEGYASPHADCGLDRALVVDLYEVSRADWLHWFPEGRGEEPRFTVEAARRDDETLQWPAYCTLREARELARRRGMRLLRPREWIRVAVGPGPTHRYPFGTVWQSSYANTLELGLLTPAPVGTFESGRSVPYGCYDLLGNVWEWVDGRVPGYWVEPELADPGVPEWRAGASVLGGSYLTPPRTPIYGVAQRTNTLAFLAQTLHEDHLSPEVGVRLGADAAEYLVAQADEWGSGEDVRRRVEAVGRRWAAAAGSGPVLAVLEPLAAADGAPRALAWLALGARGTRAP